MITNVLLLSETNCSGVVVIILVLNEFEQYTILMVSYVIFMEGLYLVEWQKEPS